VYGSTVLPEQGDHQMANFKKVNAEIKAITRLNIEAVRGDGYVYFDGDDGFGKVASVYANPVTTPTDELVGFCLEAINEVYR
jgi:hypothetical protein